MNSMLQIQNHGGQKISQLLQNADQHQRSEADRIRSDGKKHKLPRHRDSRESVIKQRMRHRRRILLADFVENKKQRRDDENSPNPGHIEKVFREFHGLSAGTVERRNVYTLELADVKTFRPSDVETPLFARQQRALARHALPRPGSLNPPIRVPRPHNIWLAFVLAGLAIDAGDDGRVSINLNVQTLVVNV